MGARSDPEPPRCLRRPSGTTPLAPKFCFRHLQPKFDVEHLDDVRRAQLALRLQKLCSLAWKEIARAGKHGFGCEYLPRTIIKPRIPREFEGEEKFIVFRYSGDNRPMVGIRSNDVFHVVWIEKDFGDLYDH